MTRLIAGAFRHAGIATVAKSTGTAAAVINLRGEDEPLVRNGPPTILEQVQVARRYVDHRVQAFVVECMALKPVYQRASEQRIMRSNVGVLTNVRHDHQDVMGDTLVEIADSLLNTCPRRGVLVTAECDPKVLDVIERATRRNLSRLIVVDPDDVTDEERARFDYVSFKENVAIALRVADLAGIDRETALDGMVAAGPDPGVLQVVNLQIGATQVTWANLFAVNDRESMIAVMNRLEQFRTPWTLTVGILNNRPDREQRTLQFADIAVDDLSFDRLVTLGAFESQVTARLVERGFAGDAIINLGDSHRPSIEEMVAAMVTDVGAAHVLLVGFANIHTEQAEMLMQYLEREAPRTPGMVDVTIADDATAGSPPPAGRRSAERVHA